MEASQDLPQKRLRPDTSGNRLPVDTNINASQPLADTNDDRPSADASGKQPEPRLQTWLEGKSYPAEYFESGHRSWEDIKADTFATRPEADGMDDLRLARKKSAADLRRQVLEASTDAPTEKTEDKSQPYRSPGYVAELEDQKSYLYDAPGGITDKSKKLCQKLLSKTQAVPQDSLFRDDRFEETCQKVRDRNEARIVEDISPLIAPSPETLKTYGAVGLKHLVFNANERWDNSRPVTKTRPQPDGSVGFNRSAYIESQVQKLLPYIGNRVPYDYLSLFLATWRTFFPFFTREAKGGTGDLDVADRQNAHSMTMAVRGIVELFKLVNRENELHRELVAFSISHDATNVRIYGHYATIEDRVPSFWRHPIRSFDFTEEGGKDKWTAYQFTMNVYFESIAEFHPLICSAIDQLPLSATPSLPRSNPPQQIRLNDSFRTDTDLESEQPDSQEMAASAPSSQNPLGPRKRRLTGNAVLERQLDRKDEELERLRQESDEKFDRLRQEYDRRIEQIVQAPSDASVDSETLKILEEYNERQKQENDRLIQQTQTSNANPGNDSEVATVLRQELERQRQESERQRQENERLRLNANSGNDSEVVTILRQELDRQRQESERQRQEMKEEHKREMEKQQE